jgi:hypothetical protein
MYEIGLNARQRRLGDNVQGAQYTVQQLLDLCAFLTRPSLLLKVVKKKKRLLKNEYSDQKQQPIRTELST